MAVKKNQKNTSKPTPPPVENTEPKPLETTVVQEMVEEVKEGDTTVTRSEQEAIKEVIRTEVPSAVANVIEQISANFSGTKQEIKVTTTEKQNKWLPEDQLSEEDLYSLDPGALPDDVVVITDPCPKFVQDITVPGSYGTKKVQEGDRLQSRYYQKLAEEDNIPGMRQANKMSKEFLTQLDIARKKRLGIIPNEYVKAAWKHKEQDKRFNERYKEALT